MIDHARTERAGTRASAGSNAQIYKTPCEQVAAPLGPDTARLAWSALRHRLSKITAEEYPHD